MVIQNTSQREPLKKEHLDSLIDAIEESLRNMQVNIPTHGSVVMNSGHTTQRVSLLKANPRLVAQYQQRVLNFTSDTYLPKMNLIARLYVAHKVLDDIDTIIQARTPKEGYTDFNTLAGSIEAELFSNPDYQRHIQALSGLAILAFHPWHFNKADYRVPDQYYRHGMTVEPEHVPAGLPTEQPEDEHIDEDRLVQPMDDGSGNYRIPMSEGLLREDIEMSPTPEARKRVNTMIEFIKAHKQDLFLPATKDQLARAAAINAGKVPEFNVTTPLQTDDQNTARDVDEKLKTIDDAACHIKAVAGLQGEPTRATTGGISVLDSQEAPIPAMGFAHTLMEIISCAINPCHAPHDVADKCRNDQIDNYLVESSELMRGIAAEEPDLVFTSATVRHGRSTMQAASIPGLHPGKIVHQ